MAKLVYISYTVEICYKPGRFGSTRNWEIEYHFLDEANMREVAKRNSFSIKSVEKLINHNSKKFRFIFKQPKDYRIEITKIIHNTPVNYLPCNDPTQPHNINVKYILAEYRMKNKAAEKS